MGQKVLRAPITPESLNFGLLTCYVQLESPISVTSISAQRSKRVQASTDTAMMLVVGLDERIYFGDAGW